MIIFDGMELKVWVDNIKRVVCGVTDNTTCQDIVIALAQAMGRTGRFTLIEKWRDNERPLAPNECPLLVLQKWGEFANEVSLVLYESGSRRKQKTLEKETSEVLKLQDRFTHNFTPPVKTSEAVIRRSLTFSGIRKPENSNLRKPDTYDYQPSGQAGAGSQPEQSAVRALAEGGHWSSSSSVTSQNSVNPADRTSRVPAPRSASASRVRSSSHDRHHPSNHQSIQHQERLSRPSQPNVPSAPHSLTPQYPQYHPHQHQQPHHQPKHQQHQPHSQYPQHPHQQQYPQQQYQQQQHQKQHPQNQQHLPEQHPQQQQRSHTPSQNTHPQTSSQPIQQKPVQYKQPYTSQPRTNTSAPNSEYSVNQNHQNNPKTKPVEERRQNGPMSNGPMTNGPISRTSAFKPVHPRLGSSEDESSSRVVNTDIPVYTDKMRSSQKQDLEEYDLDSNFPDVVKETGREFLIEEYQMPGTRSAGQGHLNNNHGYPVSAEEQERVKLLRLVTMQNERIKMQDSQLDIIDTEILSREEKLEDTKIKLSEIMDEIEELNSKLEGQSKEIVILDNGTLIDEMEKEKHVEKNIKQEISALKTRLEKCENDLHQFHTKVKLCSEDLEREREAMEADEAKRAAAEKDVQNEIDELKKQISDLDSNISEKKGKFEQLEGELESVKKDVNEKTDSLTVLEKDLQRENLKFFKEPQKPADITQTAQKSRESNGEVGMLTNSPQYSGNFTVRANTRVRRHQSSRSWREVYHPT